MNTILKRAISLVLCLVLMANCLPIGALAAEAEETVATEATETTEPTGGETNPTNDSTEPSDGDTEPSTEASEPEEIAVTGITLSDTALEVGVGAEPVVLVATVLPEDATDQTVTWTSSEPGVASVVDGVVTFGYMGEAVITATAGEFSASCTVTVGEGEWDTWEGGTVVIAGSDYQNTNGGIFSDVTATGAYKIMDRIEDDYPTAHGFLFGGDYYAHGTNTTTESTAGKNQLQNDIVKHFYPNISHEVYIQGNHDADSLTTNGTLATSGAHDTDYYGVYVINEKDYMWYNNDQTTIRKTASALEDYLNAKLEAGYSKPIFVLSHLPLHYSNRTINEGDGKYAKYIYDVLDEAGSNDLNIIFLYGHNHSTSYYEEYLGNAAVYLAEGDTIYVANEGNQYSCFSDKLTFTYMNYGFTGYLTGTAADGALTMTVFEITDSEVSVKRYDESGVHNLKSAGTNGSTPSGATYNSTVYASPQTIKLTTPEAKATYTNNGVTVTAAGITAVTATKEESPTYNTSLYSGYEVYNVEATGYEAGKSATVTIILTDGDFDTTRAITVKFPDGSTKDYTVENGTVTFTTAALGSFTLSQKKQTIIEGEDDTTTEPSEPTTTTIWRQVTSMTAGKDYLLVNYGYNANSTYATYAIGTNGHTPGATVSVLTDSEGAYIATADAAIQWSAVASTRSGCVNLKNVSSGNYLVASSSTGEQDLTVNASVTGYAYWNQNLVNSGTESEPSIVAYQSSGNGYRFVRHSNSAAGFVTYSSNSGSGKNDNWIALFEKTEITTGGSDTSTEKTYVRVDSLSELVSGEQYLFFFGGGDLMMTPEEYSYDSRTGMKYMDSPVTVGGETITGDLAAYEFTMTSSGTGWVLSNGTQELALTEYSSYNDTKKALTWESEGTVFTITGSSGSYNLYADFDDSDTYFDKNSRGMVSGYVYASGTVANFYIYRLDTGAGKPTGNITVTLDKDSGSVRQNAGVAAYTGSKLTLTYEDGTTETVNVTVGMLRDSNGNTISTETSGTYSDLSVVYTYNGKEYTVCDGGYTLTVRENIQNNYPEYPDEGAVKVNKTATGIDFQSSGIAQVEVSASGVPSKKGVDVIVMVDTSSSMKRGAGTNSEVSAPNRRIDFLQTALANLIREFQAVGDDGEQLDINVAIAEFNGYSFISGEDEPNDSAQQTATNVAEVFTGDGSKTAGAFVQASSIADPDAFAANVGAHSGTNYDYAFDTVYRLGSAINAQNDANNEDRDLFVIFMSDGAPYGYNYYGSGTTDTWEDYLNGNMTLNSSGQIVDDTGVYLKGNTHFYRTDGKHWMAEAVKGSADETYVVIDPTDSLGSDVSLDYFETNYLNTGIILDANNAEYMRSVPGLGAEVHTIGFCLYDDDQGGVNIVTADTQKALMQRLASTDSKGDLCYHETESGSDLNEIFCDIASQIAYAANNARYVDQMGGNFNLQMSTSTYTVVNDDNTMTKKTLTPKIEIISYDIYTRQDWLDGNCTESQIGDRKGTSSLMEVVRFSADGSKAYSNQIDADGDGIVGWTESVVDGVTTYTFDEDDNILADGTQEGYVAGVIYAKTFIYNTNATDVAVNGVSIPTGKTSANLTSGSTNVLPSETFYWKMGTVQSSELAMRYYVYLEGSMEGTREGGSYATNEFATLYYDNYLGNSCYKDTVSPVMAWKEANVSYAFYLVNENGEIIVNQTTGQTGSFANKIAVTNPVVYETVLLNNDEEVSSIDIASLGVLPEGYTLYDFDGSVGATYTVTINSNTTGEWEITTVKDVATTYVMQYDPENASAYSNALTENTIGHDYTHTVVWFAVLWKVQALPDSVVIDYGLPVDIHVLTNDMFGENGKLVGVGAYSDSLNLDGHDTDLASGFENSYTGTYGTATAGDDHVRYTPNTMKMNGYEKFAYAVQYTGNENAGYYYDTVTVIPATTIYYEDSFLTLTKYTRENTATTEYTAVDNGWDTEGTAIQGATQDEDRPGAFSLTDANNIYGYDSVNKGMTQFSLGSARVIKVSPTQYGTAEFSFCGTGFDVISMTSSDTGILVVQVFDANNNVVTSTSVDTYYGYQYNEDTKEWTPVENGAVDTPNAIYQVPVIQVENLVYGTYTVKLSALYYSALDHKTADASYELYLDAIRIYDPANDGAGDDSGTIVNAYKADGEGWPSYIELRSAVLAANSFDDVANDVMDSEMNGLIFIDGDASVGDAQMSDYRNYGPNNELYLAPGQRVAFLLNTPVNIKNVHIGLKSADGQPVTYTISNIARADSADGKVTAGDYYNAKTATLDTTTDMYYDLTGWKGDIIVISNTGDRYNTSGVLSITNIKSTYTSNPDAEVTTYPSADDTQPEEVSAVNETSVYMTPAAATLTLRSLNRAATEDTVPEDTVPEETEPVETQPEETEPETSEPEETQPEETVPETSEPEVTEPEEEVKVFRPKTFRMVIGRESVKVGQTVVVTVVTGTDVVALSVNGEAVSRYKENRGLRIRTWTVRLTAEEVGELTVEAVAYNAEGIASEAITDTVAVTAKKGSFLEELFGWLFG